MRIAETRFAAIDFESAGSAPGRTDEPVQIAIAHLVGTEISAALCSYVKTGNPVTWAARKVHGITDSMIKDAPRFVDLWPRIKSDMEGCWIVAHGAATEKRFLRVFPFHSFGPWVDTLDLARSVYPGLTSHALGEVIKVLGLESDPEIQAKGFRWHDARCDAIASLVLLRHLIAVCGLADAGAEVLKTAGMESYFKIRSEKLRRA
ncbi:MAG: 3'-5' exonuclease [Verrucomicrobiota bacterium]